MVNLSVPFWIWHFWQVFFFNALFCLHLHYLQKLSLVNWRLKGVPGLFELAIIIKNLDNIYVDCTYTCTYVKYGIWGIFSIQYSFLHQMVFKSTCSRWSLVCWVKKARSISVNSFSPEDTFAPILSTVVSEIYNEGLSFWKSPGYHMDTVHWTVSMWKGRWAAVWEWI